MKVSNLLQLTEHHRFCVIRRFGLSALDLRMLWTVYQPMTGGFAISLYTAMYASLGADIVGGSAMQPLGRLFLATGLEPNEQGRRRLVEETSKLEAVGLLRTIRKRGADGMAEYEFHLAAPLAPDQFFGVHHLWLLLQEKLGIAAAEEVRRSIMGEVLGDPDGESGEDISAPFYEVFRITIPSEAEGAEETGEDAWPKPALSGGQFGRDGFRPDEILRRVPRSSANRKAVERMLADAEKLAELNYIAGRFGLSLKLTAQLLDETDMFSAAGEWRAERFQERALEIYRQTNHYASNKPSGAGKQSAAAKGGNAAEPGEREKVPPREVAKTYWLPVPEQFAGQWDIRQYNQMLANTPYMEVLKLFFAPSAVPVTVGEAFVAMNIDYQLPDEVINVMIHYIRTNDLDWRRNFLDAIGANVAGKQIRTYERAVVYFRKEEQARAKATSGKRAGAGSGAGAARRQRAASPVIPVVRAEGKPEATEEDIQRMLKMAEQLKSD